MKTRASVPRLVAHRPSVLSLGALALTLLVPLQVSRAQDTSSAQKRSTTERPLQLSLGGGFAKTSSTPLIRNTQGYNLQASLGMRTPLRPLGLRFDGIFSDFSNMRVSALTANLTLSAPSRWRAVPYLLGGGGAYVDNSVSGMTAGWNLGIGLNVRAGDQLLFMESRFHSYRNSFAGQPYFTPNGATAFQHASEKFLWQPLTFGFRF